MGCGGGTAPDSPGQLLLLRASSDSGDDMFISRGRVGTGRLSLEGEDAQRERDRKRERELGRTGEICVERERERES